MKHYKRSRGFCNCLFVILIINAIQYSTAKWSSMPIVHCIHVKANHKTLFSKICQVHQYSISLNLRQFCSLNTKLVSNGHPLNGQLWQPKEWHRVCALHFKSGAPCSTDLIGSENYVPDCHISPPVQRFLQILIVCYIKQI